MKFPKVQSTFGVTPYNPDRDSDEKRRAIFEHYQSQMGAQPLPPETLPWNRPFPPGVEAQQAFDTMLQERVVDPLARAGYEGLGSGLASIPSAAHEMIVPQTEFDVAGTIIPLPGVAKAMKQGKYRKIRAAMKAEDPEKVGEIIAKQAGKTELPITQKANPAEVRSIDEKEMLRKADEANLKEQEILEKISDLKFIKKYGLEDIDNRTWSSVDPEADTEFGTCDLTGKKGPLVRMKALDKNGDEVEMEVLEDIAHKLHGLSGAY